MEMFRSIKWGLDAAVARKVEASRLDVTTDLASAPNGSDDVFISFATTTCSVDCHADATYVIAVSENIARALTGCSVVAAKSCVPLGTSRRVERAVRNANPQAEFDVASNAKFLCESGAIEDFMKTCRLMVGVVSERVKTGMGAIRRLLFTRGFPFVYTYLESAERIKYNANVYLATKIRFINETAAPCKLVDAVVKGVGLDGRICNKLRHAGRGHGGSCCPQGTSALVRVDQKHGVPQRITEIVISVIDMIKRRLFDRVVNMCGGSVKGETTAVLGVTFKLKIGDMLDGPLLTIAPVQMGGGPHVHVVDPHCRKEGEFLMPSIGWRVDACAAAQGAECVLNLIEWSQFRAIAMKLRAGAMATPRLAGFHNIYSRKRVLAAGFVRLDGVGDQRL